MAPMLINPGAMGVTNALSKGVRVKPSLPLPPSILIEGFDSKTGFFSPSDGSSVTVDTVGQDQGAGRLVFTAGPNGIGSSTKYDLIPFDSATMSVFAFLLDVGPDVETKAGADIRLGQTTVNFPSAAAIGRYPALGGGDLDDFVPGKSIRFAGIADMAGANLKQGDPLFVRVLPGPKGATPAKVDALVAGKGRPTVVYTHDDGRQGPYNERQYMASRGILGTIYLPWATVDTLNRLSLSQLQEMKALGFDIQLDGTANDGFMIDQVDAAAAVTQLLAGKKYLADNGLNPDARHFCYPGGQHRAFCPRGVVTGQTTNGTDVVTCTSTSGYQEGNPIFGDGVPVGTFITAIINGTSFRVNKPLSSGIPTMFRGSRVTLSGVTLTSGSPVLTVSSTVGLVPGMRVVAGTAIPDNATILSVDVASNTVTISAASTQTASKTVYFTDTSHPFHTNKLPAALRAAGFLSGRTTLPNPVFSKHGVFDAGMFLGSYTLTSATLGTYQNAINIAKQYGCTVFLYGHDIFPGATFINQDTTVFRQGIDLLAAERDAGNIEVLTVSQWWARDCANPLPFPIS